MVLPGIPAWLDQDIVLFHGTTDEHVQDVLSGVDESAGDHFKDFGRGFYTTTRLDLASDWAASNARRYGGSAAVIKFTAERSKLAELDILAFVRCDPDAIDFWSFIQYCRSIPGDHNRTYSKWYDVVIGPLTGNWKRQTIVPDADQISFHTRRAASLLDGSNKARIV